MTVTANVMFGLHQVPRRDRSTRAREALHQAGAAQLADRRVRLLSGGEGQRVALARALAPRPKLLLLDEPLSALDVPTRRRLRTELRRVLLDTGIPTVVVTHDRTEALVLGDRAVVLVDGRIRQFATSKRCSAAPPPPTSPPPSTWKPSPQLPSSTPPPASPPASPPSRSATPACLLGISGQHLEPGDSVLVCLRAENVALQLPGGLHRPSPRNELTATISAITADGPVSRVDLNAGFQFAAYVTRLTCDELDLHPGQTITALIKATAVHLIARST